MNMMVTELYDALMSAGADEAKARRAAEGLATSDQDFKKQFSELREDNQKMRTEMSGLKGALSTDMSVLKGALSTEMSNLRGELRQEMQSLRGEMAVMKWMAGVILGLLVAIVLRVYLV